MQRYNVLFGLSRSYFEVHLFTCIGSYLQAYRPRFQSYDLKSNVNVFVKISRMAHTGILPLTI